MAAADNLGRSALQKIIEEKSCLGLWAEMKQVAAVILAKSSAECRDFFSLTVSRVAECVCQTLPIFMKEERKTILKQFHRLVTDMDFRKECLEQVTSLQLQDNDHPSMFLSTFFSGLRDVCSLFRMARMRERMVEPQLTRPANRDKIVLYCSGWVLRSVRRNCWLRGGMRHKMKADRFKCVMDYFVEEGKHAQRIMDPRKRTWIDRKDRGEMKENGKKSGLMVPSRNACDFFEQLDAIMFTYECRSGLRESMTFESVMEKVYNNLRILDSWQDLTSSLDNETHQTAFLEFVVQCYRRFLGHAIGDRVIRCLKKRKNVAIRTHLKTNPE